VRLILNIMGKRIHSIQSKTCWRRWDLLKN